MVAGGGWRAGRWPGVGRQAGGGGARGAREQGVEPDGRREGEGPASLSLSLSPLLSFPLTLCPTPHLLLCRHLPKPSLTQTLSLFPSTSPNSPPPGDARPPVVLQALAHALLADRQRRPQKIHGREQGGIQPAQAGDVLAAVHAQHRVEAEEAWGEPGREAGGVRVGGGNGWWGGRLCGQRL